MLKIYYHHHFCYILKNKVTYEVTTVLKKKLLVS
jgi:hypothetical protein